MWTWSPYQPVGELIQENNDDDGDDQNGDDGEDQNNDHGDDNYHKQPGNIPMIWMVSILWNQVQVDCHHQGQSVQVMQSPFS